MINTIDHIINIDLATKINMNQSINIKQNDNNSHKFIINILNNSVAYDLTGTTSRIYFLKADNTKVFLDCTLDYALNGNISCLLTTQVLSYSGLVGSEITIYGSTGEILTSVTFNFIVTNVIRDDLAIESTSEFTTLTDALAVITTISNKLDTTEFTTFKEDVRLKAIKLELEDASSTFLGAIAGTGTFDLLSIPQDNSIIDSMLSSLSHIPLKEIGKNRFDKDTITTGYYYVYNTGVKTANATFCYSDYIVVNPLEDIILNKTNCHTCFYDNTKTFVSGSNDSAFKIPTDIKYMIVSTVTTSAPTMQVELGIISTGYEPLTYKLLSIPQENSIIDSMVSTLSHIPLKEIGKNRFDKDTITTGYYYVYNTGVKTVNATFCYSDYIEVNPLEVIKLNKTDCHTCFYDITKTFVSGTLDAAFTIPAAIKYMIVSTATATADTMQVELGIVSTEYEPLTYKLLSIPQENSIIDTMFSPLSHVTLKEMGKNRFNKDTITTGYYYDSATGSKLANASFCYSDYIEVNPLEDIILNKTGCHACFYDNTKTFVSGSLEPAFTIPTDIKYMIVSTVATTAPTMQVELGTVSTTYESFAYKVAKKDITGAIEIITQVVKTDGTGDFTNLSSAIASITDSSETKKYVVEIHEGTYDVFSTLTPTELSATGIILPDYVDLKGIGDKSKIILKGELLDTATLDESTRLSPLNIQKNNNLYNLTITAKNCRYAVHADNSNTFKNYEQHIENCTFEHFGNAVGLWANWIAWAEGTASGAKEYFKNCTFKGSGGFSTHGAVNYTEPTLHEFDNCQFISESSSLLLISSASTKINKVVLKGCAFTKYIQLTIASGTEIEYEVTGYANNKVPHIIPANVLLTKVLFNNEIVTIAKSTTVALTKGTPLSYASVSEVSVPGGSGKTLYAGIVAEDSAIGDENVKMFIGGFIRLSDTKMTSISAYDKIGITMGILAVVPNIYDAIGVAIDSAWIKLY